MRFRILLAAIVCLIAAPAFAQVENAGDDNSTTTVVVNPSPPKTKLETAAIAKGVLMIGGFTDIGTVAGEDGSGVRVTAVEYTNAETQEKHYGLVITVHQQQGNRYARAYLDDDELDNLLNALQSMEKLDHTATTLSDFTARYRTRGDLEIGNVASDGAREMVVRSVQIQPASGEIVWATARESLSRLGDLMQCINTGKQTLDKLKLQKELK